MSQSLVISLNKHLHLDASPTLRINERVKELWQQGSTVYHFGFGESRFPVHPSLQAALQENVQQKGYLPVQGLKELREAIASYYSRTLNGEFEPQQVIVGPGSKSLLFGLLMALEGDLILPSPSWVSYAPQARFLHKPVHYIPSEASDDYALTLEALEATLEHCQSSHKVMVINSPNNPTGLMFKPSFLKELAAFCRAHQITVISDEIYGLVPHGSQAHVTLATYYPEGTIIVGGLSKHLSLGGWRLGKAILPPSQAQLMQALISIGSEIWSSASAPIQYAAISAYRGAPELEHYIAECATLHALRTQHIWSWLVELGIRCPQPEGGFYMMPDFNRWRSALANRGVETSSDLTQYLLEEYRLAALPGVVFGLPPEQLSIRLSTSYIDLETDQQAEEMLATWRKSQDANTFIEAHHPTLEKGLDQFRRLITDLNRQS